MKTRLLISMGIVMLIAGFSAVLLFDSDAIFENNNMMKSDAEILEEINMQATIHKNNNNQEKFDEQMSIMQERQKEIASRILESDISDAYVAEGWNFPFRKTSDVEIFNPKFKDPICDVSENIPIHLKEIRKSEMFQMFMAKYSHAHLLIDISDERNHNGSIHYHFIATSDSGKNTASTAFHLDSCTGEFIFDRYMLMCKDLASDEQSFATYMINIRDSLDDDSFCVFAFKPWQENLFEYGHILSEHAEKLYPSSYYDESEEFQEGKRDSFKKSSELKLLAKISYNAGHMIDKESLEDEISKYEKRYNKMPDELQKLIDTRPAE